MAEANTTKKEEAAEPDSRTAELDSRTADADKEDEATEPDSRTAELDSRTARLFGGAAELMSRMAELSRVTDEAGRRDPLEVLPPEILRDICHRLALSDLARLYEVSRGWRAVVGDESLWRPRGLDLADEERQEPRNRPSELRILLRAPCLGVLDLPGRDRLRPGSKLAEAVAKVNKVLVLSASPSVAPCVLGLMQRSARYLEELTLIEAKLEHLKVIARMPALFVLCLALHGDLDKVAVPPLPKQLRELDLQNASLPHLRMLEGLTALKKLRVGRGLETPLAMGLRFPPQLEELTAYPVTRSQLASVGRMPALRRLDIACDGAERLPVFPARRPAGHCGLRSLAAPLTQFDAALDASIVSLVRASADTLEKLVVEEGVDDPDFELDPLYLASALRRCPLRALRRLTIRRPGRGHDCQKGTCAQEVEALTSVLRHCGTVVKCTGNNFDDEDEEPN